MGWPRMVAYSGNRKLPLLFDVGALAPAYPRGPRLGDRGKVSARVSAGRHSGRQTAHPRFADRHSGRRFVCQSVCRQTLSGLADTF